MAMSQTTLFRLISVSVCMVIGLGLYILSTERMSHFNKFRVIQPQKVETPYGVLEVSEPVLLELLASPAMERIKHVYQYGVRPLVDGYGKSYTRYDHCVGVWALLRLHGASLEEQIAGLLHDASHTVFSHVGDYLFKQADCKKSYQDDIHASYLQKQGIDEILHKYGMKIDDINPKEGVHVALDQDLPNLCADRIEYNIQEGLMAGLLNQQDVQDILTHLKFEKGQWFLTDVQAATKLARVSLYGSRYIWGGPENFVMDSLAAQALRRALDIKLISLHDIHYSVDEIVWQKLCQSTDAELNDLIKKMKESRNQCEQADQYQHDFFVRSKFRGVNPLVKMESGFLQELTKVNATYAQEYENLKNQLAQGWYIKFAKQDSLGKANNLTA